MEEILASIRRIIADDQPAKTEAAPEPAPTPSAPPPELQAAPVPIEDDILDLEDEPAAPEPDEVVFEEPPPALPEPEPEPVFVPRPAMIKEPPRPAFEPETLLSQRTDQAVGQAFQHLAGSILAGSQRTLDDIVREMLRPMLKEWLDDNLPGIVERLVRAEIERVARGGR